MLLATNNTYKQNELFDDPTVHLKKHVYTHIEAKYIERNT